MKKRIIALVLALVLCLSLGSAAMADYEETASVLTIHDASGNESIHSLFSDASGSGWSWSASAQTLTLRGFDGMGIYFDNPEGDVTVNLTPGSNNITYRIGCWITNGTPWNQPTVKLTGSGKLHATTIECRNLEIDGPTVVTEGGVQGLIMRSGSLSAAFIESDLSVPNEYHGGSISLDCEAGMAFSIWWPIEGGELPVGYDKATVTDEKGNPLTMIMYTDEWESSFYTFVGDDFNVFSTHIRIGGGAPVAPPQPSFPDVKEGEWWYANIDAAAKAGLVAGNADGSYDPKGQLTWAQTLVFATRLSQYNRGEHIYGAEDQVGKWYQIYLDYCLEKNIIRVMPENMNATISRADAAIIFSRVLFAAPDINTVPSDYYNDVKPGDDAYKAIMELTEAGITNGMGDGSFGVNGVFTRAQVAAIVARIAGLVDPVVIG